MSKNTAVFGIYANRLQIDEAMNALRQDGFRPTDISVLYPENSGSKEFAHRKSTKAPEGATAGLGTGAVLGGVLGWLTGIGALAIPELHPLAVAGPVLGTMAGAGAAGAIGGLAGSVLGSVMPEYEARRHQGRLKCGGILLSVHCDDHHWVKRAKLLLRRTGGLGIGEESEAKADFAKSDRPMRRSPRPSGIVG